MRGPSRSAHATVTTTGDGHEVPAAPSDAVRRQLASIRTRLVLVIIAVLVLGLGGTALVTSRVLEARIDTRIDATLAQEAEELRLFAAQGLNPATGAPFGDDAAALLEVFVTRSVPSEGEVLVALVDDEVVAVTGRGDALGPDIGAELVDLPGWGVETVRSEVATASGPLEYLAVPITSQGEPGGVLVVGVLRDVLAAEVDQTIRVTAVVALIALVVGIALAVALARRILQPLDDITTATQHLGDDDLSLRLAVEGHDEVAQLATAFNAMLDRLEAAFATQRDFVDDASHELRTPLTIVRGHIELLESDPDPAARRETVALVLDELDRMDRIVGDLLTLARAERPDFVTAAPFEVDELTTATLRKATGLSQQHHWRLGHVAVGSAVGDEQRLAQAMLALAHNAARHTPPGTTVTIGSAVTGRDLQLWVADDGPGVADEDRDRIFERFARGPEGPRAAGAGLGLAIVRAIAAGHGGTVRLTTPTGGGARFELHLPAAASRKAVDRQPADDAVHT